MKNKSIFNTSLFLLMFSTSLFYAQTTHTIVLTCDPSEITEENVNEVCSFGQDSSIPNKDFTIEVNTKDVIVWRGMSSDSNYSLKLKSINYKKGVDVFDEPVLRDNRGIVSAVVLKGQPGDEEKYDISFRVYKNGSRIPGKFTIDPRIKITR